MDLESYKIEITPILKLTIVKRLQVKKNLLQNQNLSRISTKNSPNQVTQSNLNKNTKVTMSSTQFINQDNLWHNLGCQKLRSSGKQTASLKMFSNFWTILNKNGQCAAVCPYLSGAPPTARNVRPQHIFASKIQPAVFEKWKRIQQKRSFLKTLGFFYLLDS